MRVTERGGVGAGRGHDHPSVVGRLRGGGGHPVLGGVLLRRKGPVSLAQKTLANTATPATPATAICTSMLPVPASR